jgi:hypothetical protein
MYSAGAKGNFDILGSHPYGFAYPPEYDPGAASGLAFRRAEQQYGVMVANGDGAKQVWATEFGWLLDTGCDWPDRLRLGLYSPAGGRPLARRFGGRGAPAEAREVEAWFLGFLPAEARRRLPPGRPCFGRWPLLVSVGTEELDQPLGQAYDQPARGADDPRAGLPQPLPTRGERLPEGQPGLYLRKKNHAPQSQRPEHDLATDGVEQPQQSEGQQVAPDTAPYAGLGEGERVADRQGPGGRQAAQLGKAKATGEGHPEQEQRPPSAKRDAPVPEERAKVEQDYADGHYLGGVAKKPAQAPGKTPAHDSRGSDV